MKKTILTVFISGKLLTLLGLIAGMILLPLQKGFLGGGLDNYQTNPYLWSWANFDGEHYLLIAQRSYVEFEQAFFPLFPLLLKTISSLTSMPLIFAGLTISHLAFLLALIIFYKLLKIDYTSKQSLWVIIFLVFFPTAYYFGSVYTESLFLLLTICSFYFYRKNNFFLAGVFGFFASLCKFVGVFLFPAILIELFLNVKSQKSKKGVGLLVIFLSRLRDMSSQKLKFLWLLLIPLGTLTYMFYLANVYGDPLFFIHAQSAFGANRSGDSLVLLPQVFFRYLKIVTMSSFTYQYIIAVLELAATVFFLLLSFLSFKKLRFSYALFAVCSLILPTLTGSLSSMPRYVLTIFPLFIPLNLCLKKDIVRYIMLFVFVALLLGLASLFTRGYWVS